MINPGTFREYLRNEKLFTAASNEQFYRVLDLLREEFPVHDIATIVWFLSTTTEKHAQDIEDDLRGLQ